MTELERARAHLRERQRMLANVRRLNFDATDMESAVLAALSWVWEEQEKMVMARYGITASIPSFTPTQRPTVI